MTDLSALPHLEIPDVEGPIGLTPDLIPEQSQKSSQIALKVNDSFDSMMSDLDASYNNALENIQNDLTITDVQKAAVTARANVEYEKKKEAINELKKNALSVASSKAVLGGELAKFAGGALVTAGLAGTSLPAAALYLAYLGGKSELVSHVKKPIEDAIRKGDYAAAKVGLIESAKHGLTISPQAIALDMIQRSDSPANAMIALSLFSEASNESSKLKKAIGGFLGAAPDFLVAGGAAGKVIGEVSEKAILKRVSQTAAGKLALRGVTELATFEAAQVSSPYTPDPVNAAKEAALYAATGKVVKFLGKAGPIGRAAESGAVGGGVEIVHEMLNPMHYKDTDTGEDKTVYLRWDEIGSQAAAFAASSVAIGSILPQDQPKMRELFSINWRKHAEDRAPIRIARAVIDSAIGRTLKTAKDFSSFFSTFTLPNKDVDRLSEDVPSDPRQLAAWVKKHKSDKQKPLIRRTNADDGRAEYLRGRAAYVDAELDKRGVQVGDERRVALFSAVRHLNDALGAGKEPGGGDAPKTFRNRSRFLQLLGALTKNVNEVEDSLKGDDSNYRTYNDFIAVLSAEKAELAKKLQDKLKRNLTKDELKDIAKQASERVTAKRSAGKPAPRDVTIKPSFVANVNAEKAIKNQKETPGLLSRHTPIAEAYSKPVEGGDQSAAENKKRLESAASASQAIIGEKASGLAKEKRTALADRLNTGEYTAHDVVYVADDGAAVDENGNLSKAYSSLDRAIEARATILTRDKSVQDYLAQKANYAKIDDGVYMHKEAKDIMEQHGVGHGDANSIALEASKLKESLGDHPRTDSIVSRFVADAVKNGEDRALHRANMLKDANIVIGDSPQATEDSNVDGLDKDAIVGIAHDGRNWMRKGEPAGKLSGVKAAIGKRLGLIVDDNAPASFKKWLKDQGYERDKSNKSYWASKESESASRPPKPAEAKFGEKRRSKLSNSEYVRKHKEATHRHLGTISGILDNPYLDHKRTASIIIDEVGKWLGDKELAAQIWNQVVGNRELSTKVVDAFFKHLVSAYNVHLDYKSDKAVNAIGQTLTDKIRKHALDSYVDAFTRVLKEYGSIKTKKDAYKVLSLNENGLLNWDPILKAVHALVENQASGTIGKLVRSTFGRDPSELYHAVKSMILWHIGKAGGEISDISESLINNALDIFKDERSSEEGNIGIALHRIMQLLKMGDERIYSSVKSKLEEFAKNAPSIDDDNDGDKKNVASRDNGVSSSSDSGDDATDVVSVVKIPTISYVTTGDALEFTLLRLEGAHAGLPFTGGGNSVMTEYQAKQKTSDMIEQLRDAIDKAVENGDRVALISSFEDVLGGLEFRGRRIWSKRALRRAATRVYNSATQSVKRDEPEYVDSVFIDLTGMSKDGVPVQLPGHKGRVITWTTDKLSRPVRLLLERKTPVRQKKSLLHLLNKKYGDRSKYVMLKYVLDYASSGGEIALDDNKKPITSLFSYFKYDKEDLILALGNYDYGSPIGSDSGTLIIRKFDKDVHDALVGSDNPIAVLKELIKRELGNDKMFDELVNTVEEDVSRALDNYESNDDNVNARLESLIWASEINMLRMYRDAYGPRYAELHLFGDLKDATKTGKRSKVWGTDGTILDFSGTKYSHGKFKYAIVQDSQYGGEEESEDGAMYFSHKMWDATADAAGLLDGARHMKPFVHEADDNLGAIGIKGAAYKASGSLNAWMEKNGIDVVFMKSATKYQGTRNTVTTDEYGYDESGVMTGSIPKSSIYEMNTSAIRFKHGDRIDNFRKGLVTLSTRLMDAVSAGHSDGAKAAADALNDYIERMQAETIGLINKAQNGDFGALKEVAEVLGADISDISALSSHKEISERARVLTAIASNPLSFIIPPIGTVSSRQLASALTNRFYRSVGHGGYTGLRPFSRHEKPDVFRPVILSDGQVVHAQGMDDIKIDEIILGSDATKWRVDDPDVRGNKITLQALYIRNLKKGKPTHVIAYRMPIASHRGVLALRIAGFSDIGGASIIHPKLVKKAIAGDHDGDALYVLADPPDKMVEYFLNEVNKYKDDGQNFDGIAMIPGEVEGLPREKIETYGQSATSALQTLDYSIQAMRSRDNLSSFIVEKNVIIPLWSELSASGGAFKVKLGKKAAEKNGIPRDILLIPKKRSGFSAKKKAWGIPMDGDAYDDGQRLSAFWINSYVDALPNDVSAKDAAARMVATMFDFQDAKGNRLSLGNKRLDVAKAVTYAREWDGLRDLDMNIFGHDNAFWKIGDMVDNVRDDLYSSSVLHRSISRIPEDSASIMSPTGWLRFGAFRQFWLTKDSAFRSLGEFSPYVDQITKELRDLYSTNKYAGFIWGDNQRTYNGAQRSYVDPRTAAVVQFTAGRVAGLRFLEEANADIDNDTIRQINEAARVLQIAYSSIARALNSDVDLTDSFAIAMAKNYGNNAAHSIVNINKNKWKRTWSGDDGIIYELMSRNKDMTAEEARAILANVREFPRKHSTTWGPRANQRRYESARKVIGSEPIDMIANGLASKDPLKAITLTKEAIELWLDRLRKENPLLADYAHIALMTPFMDIRPIPKARALRLQPKATTAAYYLENTSPYVPFAHLDRALGEMYRAVSGNPSAVSSRPSERPDEKADEMSALDAEVAPPVRRPITITRKTRSSGRRSRASKPTAPPPAPSKAEPGSKKMKVFGIEVETLTPEEAGLTPEDIAAIERQALESFRKSGGRSMKLHSGLPTDLEDYKFLINAFRHGASAFSRVTKNTFAVIRQAFKHKIISRTEPGWIMLQHFLSDHKTTREEIELLRALMGSQWAGRTGNEIKMKDWTFEMLLHDHSKNKGIDRTVIDGLVRDMYRYIHTIVRNRTAEAHMAAGDRNFFTIPMGYARIYGSGTGNAKSFDGKKILNPITFAPLNYAEYIVMELAGVKDASIDPYMSMKNGGNLTFANPFYKKPMTFGKLIGLRKIDSDQRLKAIIRSSGMRRRLANGEYTSAEPHEVLSEINRFVSMLIDYPSYGRIIFTPEVEVMIRRRLNIKRIRPGESALSRRAKLNAAKAFPILYDPKEGFSNDMLEFAFDKAAAYIHDMAIMDLANRTISNKIDIANRHNNDYIIKEAIRVALSRASDPAFSSYLKALERNLSTEQMLEADRQAAEASGATFDKEQALRENPERYFRIIHYVTRNDETATSRKKYLLKNEDGTYRINTKVLDKLHHERHNEFVDILEQALEEINSRVRRLINYSPVTSHRVAGVRVDREGAQISATPLFAKAQREGLALPRFYIFRHYTDEVRENRRLYENRAQSFARNVAAIDERIKYLKTHKPKDAKKARNVDVIIHALERERAVWDRQLNSTVEEQRLESVKLVAKGKRISAATPPTTRHRTNLLDFGSYPFEEYMRGLEKTDNPEYNPHAYSMDISESWDRIAKEIPIRLLNGLAEARAQMIINNQHKHAHFDLTQQDIMNNILRTAMGDPIRHLYFSYGIGKYGVDVDVGEEAIRKLYNYTRIGTNILRKTLHIKPLPQVEGYDEQGLTAHNDGLMAIIRFLSAPGVFLNNLAAVKNPWIATGVRPFSNIGAMSDKNISETVQRLASRGSQANATNSLEVEIEKMYKDARLPKKVRDFLRRRTLSHIGTAPSMTEWLKTMAYLSWASVPTTAPFFGQAKYLYARLPFLRNTDMAKIIRDKRSTRAARAVLAEYAGVFIKKSEETSRAFAWRTGAADYIDRMRRFAPNFMTGDNKEADELAVIAHANAYTNMTNFLFSKMGQPSFQKTSFGRVMMRFRGWMTQEHELYNQIFGVETSGVGPASFVGFGPEVRSWLTKSLGLGKAVGHFEEMQKRWAQSQSLALMASRAVQVATVIGLQSSSSDLKWALLVQLGYGVSRNMNSAEFEWLSSLMDVGTALVYMANAKTSKQFDAALYVFDRMARTIGPANVASTLIGWFVLGNILSSGDPSRVDRIFTSGSTGIAAGWVGGGPAGKVARSLR